jgi:hypothetical protein
MLTLDKNGETGCCKRFNPSPWVDKEINFDDKLFLTDHVITFFHFPLNYGKVMKRNMEKIEKAGAKISEPLILLNEKSLWRSEIYIAVEKKIPGSKLVKISGNFLSKVFEGPYSKMNKWIKEMSAFAASKHKSIKKLYFFYTTCPACAKAYGENYTVLIGEI